MSAKMQKGKEHSFLIHNDNDFIILTLLPVQNIKKEIVAYVVQYKVSPLIKALYLNMLYTALFLTILAFLLTFIAALFLANYLQVKKAAIYDLLTGIFNRSQFNAFFEQYMAQSRRYNEPLSLIFFDIDHFKRVNDTYGHEIGDAVLKELTKLIQMSIRESDTFARWGGEEFTILLPKTSLQEAVQIAEKLRQIIQNHTFPLPQRITCSFGVIEVEPNADVHSALQQVDKSLYKAKATGRNKVVAEQLSL